MRPHQFADGHDLVGSVRRLRRVGEPRGTGTALVVRVKSVLRQLPPRVRDRLKVLGRVPRLSLRRVPTDRDYVERFVASQAGVVRGRVLATRTPTLARRFGRDVTRIDVLDSDPFNDEVTILADLAEAGTLPQEAFDCVILVHALQRGANFDIAIENAWRSVAPGGALLVTVPALRAIDSSRQHLDSGYITPASLEQVVARGCPSGDVEFNLYGKLLTATPRLMIVAMDELCPVELDGRDRDNPVVACARVMKRAHA